MLPAWMSVRSTAFTRRKARRDFESVDLLYINPEECIDCGACEPACPVTAIFEESAVPVQWKEYIKINADYYEGK